MPAKYAATSGKKMFLHHQQHFRKFVLFIVINPVPEVLAQNSEQSYYYEENMHYNICISKSII